jgi:hypothetical protein
VIVVTRFSVTRLLMAVGGSLLVVSLLIVRVTELGLGVLEVVLGCASLAGAAMLVGNYPLRTVFDGEGVHIRTPSRARRVRWDEVLSVRRTRGWRVVSSTGHRTSRGGIVLITPRGSMLASDRPESAELTERLALLLDGVSPALADSVRSASPVAR